MISIELTEENGQFFLEVETRYGDLIVSVEMDKATLQRLHSDAEKHLYDLWVEKHGMD